MSGSWGVNRYFLLNRDTIQAMTIEIDQSNRLEDAGPTFLAFSNHISYVIKVPTRVKKVAKILIEAKAVSKNQVYPLLWASCLFLLLNPHLDHLTKTASKIVIDNEFDGHQVLIKSALLRHIRRRYDKFPAHKIVIGSIGKKSMAHKKALAAYRKKRRSMDRTITVKEFKKRIFGRA